MNLMGKLFARTISAAMSQLRTSSELFKEKRNGASDVGSPRLRHRRVSSDARGHVGNEAEQPGA